MADMSYLHRHVFDFCSICFWLATDLFCQLTRVFLSFQTCLDVYSVVSLLTRVFSGCLQVFLADRGVLLMLTVCLVNSSVLWMLTVCLVDIGVLWMFTVCMVVLDVLWMLTVWLTQVFCGY